jgi:hypothetical protein
MKKAKIGQKIKTKEDYKARLTNFNASIRRAVEVGQRVGLNPLDMSRLLIAFLVGMVIDLKVEPRNEAQGETAKKGFAQFLLNTLASTLYAMKLVDKVDEIEVHPKDGTGTPREELEAALDNEEAQEAAVKAAESLPDPEDEPSDSNVIDLPVASTETTEE